MFGNKTQDLIGLYKNTIKLIGKDKDLLYPMVYMGIYRAISVCLSFSCIYFFLVAKSGGQGFLTLLACMAYLPVSSYLQIRHQAALGWMSFEVLSGKDTNLAAGMERLDGVKGKLFLIGMMNMLVNQSSAQKTKNGGFKEFIVALALSVFKGVWELVQNYMVPTLVIEKCSFEEAAAKLKTMKQNIPAAIGGVLGMDIGAGVVTALLGPLFFAGFIIGGGMGYFGHGMLPEAWQITMQTGQIVNILPLFAILFLSSLVSSFIMAGVSGIKAIYYSTFYVSINRPMDIADEFRDEVTNYLNFKNQLKGYDFFKQFKVKEDNVLQMSANAEYDQATVIKIKKAFESNLSKGHGPEKVEAFLVEKGFKPELVNYAFEEFLEEGSQKILPFIKSKVAEGHSKSDVAKFFQQKGVPGCIVRKALKAG